MTPISTPAVPPLVDGERLTREEFHRRYMAMPHVKKAELIEGVVHMSSPVRWDIHATPHALLVGWLVFYHSQTPGVRPGDNGTLILEGDNEPQPDVALLIERENGGQAELGTDGHVARGPEFVGEIAASSASRDRGARLRMYRANGVHEYLICRTEAEAIDWLILRDDRYVPLTPVNGIHRSEAFPGLWLDTAAMLRGDLAAVFAVLQQGMATPEHAAFVARLTSPRP